MSYEQEKYMCTPETAKETLEQYGVAIIPDVLNKEECEQFVEKIWDYFEHITQLWDTPLSRVSKKTWLGIYDLYPSHSMLFQHHSIGQSQAVWDVRQNKKVVDVYSQIWKIKPEDLLVSFDGLSFGVPPEITNRGWNRNHTWYHSDQSFTRKEFECIQGWVTGLDVNEGDATLAFYEGSNKLHGEFGDRFNITDKADWYKLKKEEEQFYKESGCTEKKIKCPKGSLVLWDSRTIHCGTEAMRTRKKANFRAIAYTCYQPRSLSNDKQIQKKQKAFNDIRMTSHWPAKIKLFPKKPRTYGGKLPEVTPISHPKLTELGKRLAGF